jgi:transposase
MGKRNGKTSVIATEIGSIGIDLGDETSCVCVLDQAGTVIERSTVRTTKSAFGTRFQSMSPARVAIETGTHSPWVSRTLKQLGHEVIVANARKLRLIYENDGKDDRVDAEYLARIARLDPKLLSPVEHRTAQSQADRALLRARDGLVRARTALVTQVRGLVKSEGARLPQCSTESFAKTVASSIPESIRAAVTPLLGIIQKLTQEIGRYDKRVEALAKKSYPAAARVAQVPGVGPITALAYVLTIGDPARFRKSRALGAYLGLRPKKAESGRCDPELRITKAGDSFLRRLLVQSAQYTLGPFAPDSDLRRWGLELASRGRKNAKKRAVVAVARKLAVLLHSLWRSGADYIALRGA